MIFVSHEVSDKKSLRVLMSHTDVRQKIIKSAHVSHGLIVRHSSFREATHRSISFQDTTSANTRSFIGFVTSRHSRLAMQEYSYCFATGHNTIRKL